MTLGEWLAEVEGPTASWDACKLVPGDKRALPVSKSVNAIREPLPRSFCGGFLWLRYVDPGRFPGYWEFPEVG